MMQRTAVTDPVSRTALNWRWEGAVGTGPAEAKWGRLQTVAEFREGSSGVLVLPGVRNVQMCLG